MDGVVMDGETDDEWETQPVSQSEQQMLSVSV